MSVADSPNGRVWKLIECTIFSKVDVACGQMMTYEFRGNEVTTAGDILELNW